MSADNFFVLRRHPKGGFAWVMGFASDGEAGAYTDPVRENAERFETVEAAVTDYNNGQEWREGYYPKYYCEYGMEISQECYEVETTEEVQLPGQQFVVLIHDLVRNIDTKIVVTGNPDEGYSVRQYDPIDNHLEKTFIVLGD